MTQESNRINNPVTGWDLGGKDRNGVAEAKRQSDSTYKYRPLVEGFDFTFNQWGHIIPIERKL